MVLAYKLQLALHNKATAYLQAQSTLSVKNLPTTVKVVTAPLKGANGEQKQQQQPAVRCGVNLYKADQEQEFFCLIQWLSAGREPGDAPT